MHRHPPSEIDWSFLCDAELEDRFTCASQAMGHSMDREYVQKTAHMLRYAYGSDAAARELRASGCDAEVIARTIHEEAHAVMTSLRQVIEASAPPNTFDVVASPAKLVDRPMRRRIMTHLIEQVDESRAQGRRVEFRRPDGLGYLPINGSSDALIRDLKYLALQDPDTEVIEVLMRARSSSLKKLAAAADQAIATRHAISQPEGISGVESAPHRFCYLIAVSAVSSFCARETSAKWRTLEETRALYWAFAGAAVHGYLTITIETDRVENVAGHPSSVSPFNEPDLVETAYDTDAPQPIFMRRTGARLRGLSSLLVLFARRHDPNPGHLSERRLGSRAFGGRHATPALIGDTAIAYVETPINPSDIVDIMTEQSITDIVGDVRNDLVVSSDDGNRSDLLVTATRIALKPNEEAREYFEAVAEDLRSFGQRKDEEADLQRRAYANLSAEDASRMLNNTIQAARDAATENARPGRRRRT